MDIVNIQTEMMCRTVHKIFFVKRVFRVLVPDLRSVEQPDFDHFRFHQLIDKGIVFFRCVSRIKLQDGLLLNAKNQIVQLALAGREFSVHGNGSRHIRRIIGILGTKIEKHHIAVAANLVVFDVMQHTRIGSRSNDGKIGVARCAVHGKFMFHFSLYLVFLNTRPDKLQHPSKRLTGDLHRLANQFDLFVGFYHSQCGNQRSRTPVLMRRIVGLQFIGKTLVAGQHIRTIFGIFVGIEIHFFGPCHHVPQCQFKFVEPFDVCYSRYLPCFVKGQFVAVPDGDLFVGLYQKKYFPQSGVGMVGGNQQNAFFLINTR